MYMENARFYICVKTLTVIYVSHRELQKNIAVLVHGQSYWITRIQIHSASPSTTSDEYNTLSIYIYTCIKKRIVLRNSGYTLLDNNLTYAN